MTEAEKLKLKAKARRRRMEAEQGILSGSGEAPRGDLPTAAPTPSPPAAVPDEEVDTLSDMGWSALSSIPKGIASTIGMAKDVGGDFLGGGFTYGIDRLLGYTPEEAQARLDELKAVREKYNTPVTAPRSKDVRDTIETVTGPLYDPKTVAGEFVDTTGQAVTGGMLMGAGGPVARFIQGFIPGVSSEAAGQTARRVAPEYEGLVRTGTALATGLAANRVTAPRGANRVISDAMEGVTKPQMNAAMRLMQDSNRAGGVPLTWPEAIQHVTGGRTTLDDVARFVENSRFGGPTMRQFYADRPQRVESAVNTRADAIDPVRRPPEVVGPRVQQGAQGYLDEVNDAINVATKPLYDAAKPVRLGRRDMQQILANPSYKSKVQELRSHPYLGDYFKRVKADSVEMIDAVKKLMQADIDATPLSPKGIDRFAQSAATKQKQTMVNIAKTASQEYDDALRIQADLRQNALDPLQKGQTGKLAATDDLGQQLNSIFPANPLPNSEAGVRQAVRALARKDKQLASNLVGAHIDRVFAEAGQKLASGPNQAGGAKFAAVIAGNSQQAKNLEAAIRALPDGDTKWVGFKKLLENLEATGRRKPVGSPTDMNTAIRQDLRSGGIVGETMATVGSPAKWATKVMDTYQSWRLGRNTEELARIFTDPQAGKLLSRLAMLKPGTPEYVDAVTRVILLSQTPRDEVPAPNRN